MNRLSKGEFSRAQVGVVAQRVTPDTLGHDATSTEPRPGAAGVQGMAILCRAAFAELRLMAGHVVAVKNRVVVRRTLRGAYRGLFIGVVPTGQAAGATDMTTYHLVDGRIAEAKWSVRVCLPVVRRPRAPEDGRVSWVQGPRPWHTRPVVCSPPRRFGSHGLPGSA